MSSDTIPDIIMQLLTLEITHVRGIMRKKDDSATIPTTYSQLPGIFTAALRDNNPIIIISPSGVTPVHTLVRRGLSARLTTQITILWVQGNAVVASCELIPTRQPWRFDCYEFKLTNVTPHIRSNIETTIESVTGRLFRKPKIVDSIRLPDLSGKVNPATFSAVFQSMVEKHGHK